MAKSNNNNPNNVNANGQQAEAPRASVASRASDNPVTALAGGFAVGALIGALLPASRREREALQPLGAKVSEAARGAVDTGRDKFGRLSDEVVTQVRSTVSDVVAKAKDEVGA